MTARSWRRRSSGSTGSTRVTDARALALVAALFSVAGVVLVIVTVVLGVRTWSWMAEADRVDGTVLELHRSTSTDDDGDTSVTYRPEVEYVVDGETHRFVSSSGSNPPMYDVGEDVTVAVNPDDPEDARLTGFFAYFAPMITGILGVAFVAVSSWLWILRRRDRRRKARLAEAGGEVGGEVIEVSRRRRSGTGPGTSTTVRVAWTDANGIEQVTSGSRSDAAADREIELGDRIRVRTDPADPTNSTIVWESVRSGDPDLPTNR